MMTSLSPFTRRLIALSLLGSLIWAIGTVSITFVAARLQLADELDGLRTQYAALHSRRVDLNHLNSSVRDFAASPLATSHLIKAPNRKDASLQLQKLVRAIADRGNAQLVSLKDATGTPQDGQVVSINLRVRVPDQHLASLILAIEKGPPYLTISDLSIVAKTGKPDAHGVVEFASTVGVAWLPERMVEP